MNKIRVTVDIALNGEHALNLHQLEALKRPVVRGVAAFLPPDIAVDTITVASIAEHPRRRRIERS